MMLIYSCTHSVEKTGIDNLMQSRDCILGLEVRKLGKEFKIIFREPKIEYIETGEKTDLTDDTIEEKLTEYFTSLIEFLDTRIKSLQECKDIFNRELENWKTGKRNHLISTISASPVPVICIKPEIDKKHNSNESTIVSGFSLDAFAD